jgi:hypothetical protein
MLKYLLLAVMISIVCRPAYARRMSRNAQDKIVERRKPCDNEFIDTLKLVNVKLYPRVQTKADFITHCKAEWSAHGTCCDGDSLARAFIAEKSKAIDSVATIKQYANDIVNATKAVLTAIHTKYKVPQSSSKASVGAFGSVNMKLVQKDRLNSIIRSQVHNTIERSSNTCWNFMLKARGSALCSVCSGRSKDFFTGTKALVNIQDCEAAIANCKDFFTEISTFTTQLSNFLSVITVFDDHLTQKEVNKITELETQLKIFVPHQKLLDAMNNYNHKSKASISMQRFLDSNKICGHIFKIRKPTFLEEMDHIMAKKESVLSVVTNTPIQIYSQLNANQAMRPTIISPRGLLKREISTFASNWQYLQIKTSNTDLFSSDSQVYLPPQDNIFGAFDGAKGTSLDNQCSNSIPIDLSASFP